MWPFLGHNDLGPQTQGKEKHPGEVRSFSAIASGSGLEPPHLRGSGFLGSEVLSLTPASPRGEGGRGARGLPQELTGSVLGPLYD